MTEEKSIGQVVREEFVRIRERYEGVHDAIVPMRASHVAKIEEHVKALEAQVSVPRRPVCSCCNSIFDFTIPAKADAAPYEAMSAARIDAMKEVDAKIAAGGA